MIKEEKTPECGYSVPLTKGYRALVDEKDYKWISAYKWRANVSVNKRKVYASRVTSRKDGPQKQIMMHRQIMGLESKDEWQVDHINGNTLDCRRSNLRLATGSQNSMNRIYRRKTKSGVPGITKSHTDGMWNVRVQCEGKRYWIGTFRSIEEAIENRNFWIRAYHGEFGITDTNKRGGYCLVKEAPDGRH